MRKITFVIFVALSFLLFSCVTTEENPNTSVKSELQKDSKSSSRFQSNKVFANSGGNLSLSTEQIQSLCSTLDVNYSNLRGFVLYTTGTENG